LTINVVICFITILGGCTIGRTPLNIIQMLWVNLIMDVLGAIALGTEHPKDSGDARISRKDGIITPVMWRQIICMGIY
jgi:Ca2+-transporting ATPase